MSELDQEEVSRRFEHIVESILTLQKQTDDRYEKMEVALTGTLRLLSSGKSIVQGLHGSPEALQQYLLRELSNLRNTSFAGWNRILTLVRDLQNDLRKQ